MLKLTAIATVLNVFFFGFGNARANVKQIAAPLQPPVVTTSTTRAAPGPAPTPRSHAPTRSAHDNERSNHEHSPLIGFREFPPAGPVPGSGSRARLPVRFPPLGPAQERRGR